MNELGLIRRADQTGIPLLMARLILAGMFIYMGSVKIADPVEFLKLVRQYHMLPESPAFLLNTTAIVLPWLEVVVGTALLLGLHVRGAALAATIMLVVFTPAIFLRALEIRAEKGISFFQVEFNCGCGGGIVIIWKKLLENMGLVVLSLVALLSASQKFRPARWVEQRWLRADVEPQRETA